MSIDIRLLLNPDGVYWTDNGNCPNWDDPHYLKELIGDQSTVAECLYSAGYCHQVIYRNQIVWISDVIIKE